MLAQGNHRKMTGFRRYINIRGVSGPVETIDEFDTLQATRDALKEYRLVYQGTDIDVYASSRCTNDWRNS